jgi:hypothetical protein
MFHSAVTDAVAALAHPTNCNSLPGHSQLPRTSIEMVTYAAPVCHPTDLIPTCHPSDVVNTAYCVVIKLRYSCCKSNTPAVSHVSALHMPHLYATPVRLLMRLISILIELNYSCCKGKICAVAIVSTLLLPHLYATSQHVTEKR